MFNLWKVNNITTIVRTNHSSDFLRKIRKLSSNFSTKVAIVDDIQNKELARTIDTITNITTKTLKKSPQKPPFAKNLFLGVFDTDILAYPEVLDKNTVDSLEKDILLIKDYFENIDHQEQKRIPQSTLTNLSNLKLIGLQALIFDGGRQLSLTESCRYLEEMSRNTSRIGITDNEQLGVNILLKYGDDAHKKYLKQLLNGKTVISCCISEANTSTPGSLNLKAALSPDKKTWVINGVKRWVINGDTAELFIVFAETEEINKRDQQETIINTFVVERAFGGITSNQCEATGLDQTDISDITFENTQVPAENMVGEFNKGDKIISSILTEYRLSKGPVCIALLKNAINKFIKHCIEIDNGTNNILETEAIQAKIGELTTMLYAIESVTYLTAGLMDQYENQDCELEAAIVKALSATYCNDSIGNIMHFMGTPTFMKDNWCNKFFCDSLGHVLLNEPVDGLKLIISLLGLQHAGISLVKEIKMMRNPLFHPGAMFKKMWTQRKHIEDNPKLTLKLHEYLHPSALIGARYLEYSVLRLQFATETLLSRYGQDIIGKHIELQRLAECIIDIYAMTAVLGRVSRSYCIGLPHGDIEMQIATGFVARATERVKDNVRKIWDGTYNTADEKFLKTGKYSIKQKVYFPAHPLTRNY